MSDPARVEIIPPPVGVEGHPKETDNTGNQLPGTTAEVEQAAATKIATALGELGHKVTPKEVSVQQSTHTVLAKVEDQGLGAKVTDFGDDVGHVLNKAVENARKTYEGLSIDYTTPGSAGDEIARKRMSRWSIAKKAPQRIIESLYKKAA